MHASPSTESGWAFVPRLGLRANARQFWLLVLVNAFVGAMVGLERTVLPLLAEREFGWRPRAPPCRSYRARSADMHGRRTHHEHHEHMTAAE